MLNMQFIGCIESPGMLRSLRLSARRLRRSAAVNQNLRKYPQRWILFLNLRFIGFFVNILAVNFAKKR